MAAGGSKGCFQCRKRRVKCDEKLPSCQRCVKRDEVCTGYRDDATLIFRSENEKIKMRVHRRASFDNWQSTGTIGFLPDGVVGFLDRSPNVAPPPFWVKGVPRTPCPADPTVDRFFEKYVMYPCNHGSTPGFLENLPSLFKESHVEGRLALRWAVRAAAYASLSCEISDGNLGDRALQCYGLALSALGEALADPKQAPDDYTLMTVVVLDIFESIFLPDSVSQGSHAGGMAQILRLRGPDHNHGARGWSVFRLSHHRLQKQQLAFKKAPLPESEGWLEPLNNEIPYVHIEKSNLQISKTCDRARSLLQDLSDSNGSIEQTLEMIREMHVLDHVSTTWRGSGWSFKTIPCPEGIRERVSYQLPEVVQLHSDVWIAYEWNYHRTARIILHEHLLKCLTRLENSPARNQYSSNDIVAFKEISFSVIRSLIDSILSTVPQSLGDIDHTGNIITIGLGTKTCQAVGAYFLLWPIKIMKSTPSALANQTIVSKAIFERIRECTGMKTTLGAASCI